ncbi:unnamed protein product, partial [Medioppia subpectinata]
YSIVSDEVLLDMVKVLTFALTEGKVAIHCHAGLGRTGVLIASYLVFAFRAKPHDAIRYVRSKRIHRQMGLNLAQILQRQKLLLHGYESRHLKYVPKIIYMICERLLKLCGRHKAYSPGVRSGNGGTIGREIGIHYQLDKSESFCKYFFAALTADGAERVRHRHHHRRHLRGQQRPDSNNTVELTSGIVSPKTDLTELEDFSSSSSADNTPKTVRKAAKMSHRLGDSNGATGVEKGSDTAPPQTSLPPVDGHDMHAINAPMHQINVVGIETPVRQRTDGSGGGSSGQSSSSEPFESSLSESLTSLIESLGYRVIKIDSSQMVYEQDLRFMDSRRQQSSADTNNDSIDYHMNDKLIDDEFFGRTKGHSDYYNDDQLSDDSESMEDSLDAQCSSGFISANCGNSTGSEDCDELVDRKDVVKALLADYTAYVKPFSYNLLQYQKDLNTKPLSWEKLCHETNVQILSALLWSWIDSLTEPMLTKTALCHIVVKAEVPVDALLKLDQYNRYTVEYLLRFIARLGPESDDRSVLLRHLMSRLTKQRFKLADGQLVPNGNEWPEMRKGTAGRIMLFIDDLYQMLKSN